MRIDYSPPRKSSGSMPTTGKQRTTSGITFFSVVVVFVVCLLMLGIGFGTGWYFSQQATKRAFRDAMEQSSLENSSFPEDTNNSSAQPPLPVMVTDKPIVTSATPSVASDQESSDVSGAALQKQDKENKADSTKLSFYDNLSSGQQNIVLGSGINEKIDQVTGNPLTAKDAAVNPKTTEKSATAQNQPPPPAAPATQQAKNPGWVVQVAAFPSLNDAEALKARLVAKGYTASVMETNLNDRGTWYRVRIGRNMSQEAAMDIASRIGGGAKAIADSD